MLNRSTRYLTPLLSSAAAALILLGQALAGEPVKLQTQCQRGDLSRVTVSLDVQGDLLLAADGKHQKLPMRVAGSFTYDEMRLDDCTGQVNRKAVRYYRSAGVEIQIEKQTEKSTLRDDRRLILVNSGKKGIVISAPTGPLTRDEFDLLDVPGNSLIVEGLLPTGEVKAGDSWKPAAEVIGGLLGLEAVSRSDVQCVLSEPQGSTVEIAISGQLNGAAGGVASEIDLEGKGMFDLEHKRLNSIQLRIKERRSIGFVAPGFEVVAQLKMEIAPLAGSDQLTGEIIKALPTDSPEIAPPLLLHSSLGAFQLIYDARWHITRDEADLTVLRLLDRGELVAQCNVSGLPKLPANERFTLEEFQSDVQKALGKNLGQLESAAERKTPMGLRLLKVVASGNVSGLPIQWRYYLAIDPEGRRVALTYTLETTLESKLLERFADADATMIDSLEILATTTAAAAEKK